MGGTTPNAAAAALQSTTQNSRDAQDPKAINHHQSSTLSLFCSQVHLVEVSPFLRSQQWQKLSCSNASGGSTQQPESGVSALNGAQVGVHAQQDLQPSCVYVCVISAHLAVHGPLLVTLSERSPSPSASRSPWHPQTLHPLCQGNILHLQTCLVMLPHMRPQHVGIGLAGFIRL